MTQRRATFVGFAAVLLWSLLALFTVGSAPTPPLLLNTMCFSIGGAIGLLWAGYSGGLSSLRTVPLHIYLFGTLGLFGYHTLYFYALRNAPAAEAGLIAYLWPLLIVIFSGLLPNERLRPGHVVGAFVGFAGAALIVSGGEAGFSTDNATGYALAFLCALTWSGYSVVSRRVGTAPTASVGVFCLATAALSLPLHFLLETTVVPQSMIGWSAIIGLGLGPVGLAFFVWDIGVKRGDIQLLGAASYAAPLLSTVILILAGVAEAQSTLIWSSFLIAGGAAIAARASMRRETDPALSGPESTRP
ncbi:MAG: EamA family transporter [Pseudomonadota bacterium]